MTQIRRGSHQSIVLCSALTSSPIISFVMPWALKICFPKISCGSYSRFYEVVGTVDNTQGRTACTAFVAVTDTCTQRWRHELIMVTPSLPPSLPPHPPHPPFPFLVSWAMVCASSSLPARADLFSLPVHTRGAERTLTRRAAFGGLCASAAQACRRRRRRRGLWVLKKMELIFLGKNPFYTICHHYFIYLPGPTIGNDSTTGYIKLVQVGSRFSRLRVLARKKWPHTGGRLVGELTGFFPRIDRIFPSSTSKRYSKG